MAPRIPRTLLLPALAVALGLAVLAAIALFLPLPPEVPPAVRPLRRGGERAFGGWLDPHLHLSVSDVEVRDLGGPPPDRRLWTVTVRARSDARRVTVHTSWLRLTVRDAAGREYAPLPGGVEGEPPGAPPRLGRALAPGDAFERTFVFDLPAAAGDPTLWIAEDSWVARHSSLYRRTPLYERAVFPLAPPPDARPGTP